MLMVDEVTRVTMGAARMTTSAVGAVGGGVVGGIGGGIRGTVDGVRGGIRAGSKSAPAAVLTLAAAGAVGLVEWPILAVGGVAVVLNQLNSREVHRRGHDERGDGHARTAHRPAKRVSSSTHASGDRKSVAAGKSGGDSKAEKDGKSDKTATQTSHATKNHRSAT